MSRVINMLCAMLLLMSVQSAMAANEEVNIETSWGKICATLSAPDGGSDTAFVIVAGSGATDRDGNSLSAGLKTYCYAMLSDEIVKGGYAVLRYDKRAIGQSVIPQNDIPNLVFEDYVDDAEVVVEFLRSRGYKRVVMAGHSEGGLISLVVAERNRVMVDGVVLLCAPGYGMDSILATQLGEQLMPANMALMFQADRIIKSLKKGESVAVESIPAELLGLFHPVVQPFIISEMQYDPQALIAKCDEPILIVSGGNDVQVSMANGEALKRAQPRADHKVFERMTHVLKDSDERDRVKQILSVYSSSNTPLSEGVASAMIEFVNNIK